MSNRIGLRHRHAVVGCKNRILVFGGSKVSSNAILSYNLHTEEWRKQLISDQTTVPPPIQHSCAVLTGRAIYIFGGRLVKQRALSNTLWRLTTTSAGLFFNEVQFSNKVKTPAPRAGHSGWEYADKLWTFGGSVDSREYSHYLNDYGEFEDNPPYSMNNQLLCFNPSSCKWSNLKCLGDVPSPRAMHATTTIGDKAWLYGGFSLATTFDELFELNLCSLAWTQLQTGQPRPQGSYSSTLTAITETQLVLHGGMVDRSSVSVKDTWILDLPSKSWRLYTSDDENARYGILQAATSDIFDMILGFLWGSFLKSYYFLYVHVYMCIIKLCYKIKILDIKRQIKS